MGGPGFYSKWNRKGVRIRRNFFKYSEISRFGAEIENLVIKKKGALGIGLGEIV